MELLRLEADLGISAPRPKMGCKVCALATVTNLCNFIWLSLLLSTDKPVCAHATDDSDALWETEETNNLSDLKGSSIFGSAKAWCGSNFMQGWSSP